MNWMKGLTGEGMTGEKEDWSLLTRVGVEWWGGLDSRNLGTWTMVKSLDFGPRAAGGHHRAGIWFGLDYLYWRRRCCLGDGYRGSRSEVGGPFRKLMHYHSSKWWGPSVETAAWKLSVIILLDKPHSGLRPLYCLTPAFFPSLIFCFVSPLQGMKITWYSVVTSCICISYFCSGYGSCLKYSPFSII